MTLGKQEFSVSPRLVVEMHVQKEKPAVITATIKVPCKFQCGGLVDRKQLQEDNPDGSVFHLYKVVEVPLEHDDVSSNNRVRCQWSEQQQ